MINLYRTQVYKEYGLGEIADRPGLNHGTCANIIKTLVNREYFEQQGKKHRFKSHSKAYYLTENFSYKKELLKVSIDQIKKLKEKFNESCILAIVKDNLN